MRAGRQMLVTGDAGDWQLTQLHHKSNSLFVPGTCHQALTSTQAATCCAPPSGGGGGGVVEGAEGLTPHTTHCTGAAECHRCLMQSLPEALSSYWSGTPLFRGSE